MIPGIPIPAAAALARIFSGLGLAPDDMVPEHIAIQAIGSVNDTAAFLLAGDYTECTPAGTKDVRFFQRGAARIEVMPGEFVWKPHFAYALRNLDIFEKVTTMLKRGTGVFGSPVDKSGAGSNTVWELYKFQGDETTYIQVLHRAVEVFDGVFPKK